MNPLARIGAALDRLRLGQQLYGAFGALLLLTAVLAGMALVGLRAVDDDASVLKSKWLVGVGELAQARALVVEQRDFELKHSRTDDKSYHAEYEEKIEHASQALAGLMRAYGERVVGDEEQALNATLSKALADYQQSRARVLKMGRDGQQQDAADVADGASSMAFDEAMAALQKLSQLNHAGGQAAADEAHAVYLQVQSAILAVGATALLLGLGLAYLITSRLLAQLGGEPRQAVGVAKAVAGGDLTTAIAVRPGDAHSLMACLAAMQQALASAVADVRRGSEQVATASMQIAQGNQDLSGRTEQQASALQQTAATMDELGVTVRNNADNAQQASQLAQGAARVAVKGGEVVGEVVATMKGINDSSRQIADIIGVIDGIAFQTNILALNAAVEAARAGEQGRGFAVVAGEVRNLAQRSAAAAREIKGLITASVERVEHGSALVGRAGQTMDEIVGAIRRVSDIVGEISAASTEQSAGVTQVGQAVTAMDRGTQQNAALVEQSAAAAESLKVQAQQLVQAVAVFRVADGSAGATRPASPAAPSTRPAAPPTRREAVPRRAAAARPLAAATAGDDDWQRF